MPFMALLKRDAFNWTPDVDRVFRNLKQMLMSARLLQLSDFNNHFIVECDASCSGFGVVLRQGDGPIAFFNRVVAAHHANILVYERELIGLVKVVRHWRPYLWGCFFLAHTNHFSLNFILDQRLTPIP
jgi:hypothetical protein